MTCQHNYMQSPVDSNRRFCCICGEPEEHFGRSDVCEHGSLRRKCPICERNEEIATLKAEVARLRSLTQWQPIQTAPIGQQVLLLCKKGDWIGLPKHFVCISAVYRDTGPGLATHWMPMPTPAKDAP